MMALLKKMGKPTVRDRLVQEVAGLEHDILTATREREHAEAQINLYNTRLTRALKMLADINNKNTVKGA